MNARETAGDILDFLQFYVIWHFEQEEKYMDEYNCPLVAENKQAYAEFMNTFNQFYIQWQEGVTTPTLVRQTYLELEQWLVNHVLGVGSQLRKCVEG